MYNHVAIIPTFLTVVYIHAHHVYKKKKIQTNFKSF